MKYQTALFQESAQPLKLPERPFFEEIIKVVIIMHPIEEHVLQRS